MAAPEGVGPESEKAARPGAPSHLLGLRLGTGRDCEGALTGGTPFIRRWEIGATALQRPKRPDPLDYLIDASWREGGTGTPLGPHPTPPAKVPGRQFIHWAHGGHGVHGRDWVHGVHWYLLQRFHIGLREPATSVGQTDINGPLSRTAAWLALKTLQTVAWPTPPTWLSWQSRPNSTT